MKHVVEVANGTAMFHPQGECTLVEAVELVRDAVEYCRIRNVPKLLFNAAGLADVSVPTLVDRFLMVEEWAHEAEGEVAVVLVVDPEYIHPEKFGVVVATHFGLICDVFPTEAEATEWLEGIGDPG
jgi:hypothetical protein